MSLGPVAERIATLVADQVRDRGVVVWYDPNRAYVSVVKALDDDLVPLPEGTHVTCWDGSYLALRRSVDGMLGGDRPPLLVVYVPADRADARNALIELEMAGAVMRPGALPPPCNTDLAVRAREALAGRLPAAHVDQLVADATGGRIGLEEMDRQASQWRDQRVGALFEVYGVWDPVDIARAFLLHPEKDETLVAREALPALVALLAEVFGAKLSQSEAAALRSAFGRLVVRTDAAQLFAPPDAPAANAEAQACIRLASTWRGVREPSGRGAYVEQASAVDKELRDEIIGVGLDALRQSEALPTAEARLQRLIEQALAVAPTQAHVDLARERQRSVWSQAWPEVLGRWALIAAAGRLLLEVAHVDGELRSRPWTARELFEQYAAGERPWCEIDSAHRHLEERYHADDAATIAFEPTTQQLLSVARQRYHAVANELAERFTRTLVAEHFELAGGLRQRDTFAKGLRPLIGESKTAYVWVDALRYEMARDLVARLGDGFEASLRATMATAPTITDVGMAALVPGAEGEVELVQNGPGKVALRIGDKVVGGIDDRVVLLRAATGGKLCHLRLDDFDARRRDVQEAVKAADVVLLTSQEIDLISETGNVKLARRAMDGIIQELATALRGLAHLGVARAVVVADHGFVFGESLDTSTKIDPPGGQTVDLHRRCWVGRGGKESPSYLRARAADVGLGGDLELAFPWNLGGFKAGGTDSGYLHGGLSLMEAVVPVVVLTAKAATPGAGRFTWTLTLGSKQITAPFLSVSVQGHPAGKQLDLFAAPPHVRLELRVGGTRVSRTEAASYGRAEGAEEIELRYAPNRAGLEPVTITLIVPDERGPATASLHLLDAEGGELAAERNIPLHIGM